MKITPPSPIYHTPYRLVTDPTLCSISLSRITAGNAYNVLYVPTDMGHEDSGCYIMAASISTLNTIEK